MRADIDGLHPKVRQLCIEFLKASLDAGFYVSITQALRTIAEQDALFAQGRTKPGPIVTYARGGHSYHNYGLAFDFAVLQDGKETWNAKVDVNGDQKADYVQLGELGESLGLEWGGRWTRQDLPHLQYTFGLSIDQLAAGIRPPQA
jgi:peptidoglycan L-alanyl-D-glutamate endopeptidase CwlK